MPAVRAPLAALMLFGCGGRTVPLTEAQAADGGEDARVDVLRPKPICAASSGQMVVLAPDQYPSGFAIDEGYLYWLDQGSIRRVSKLGGSPQTIAPEPLDYAAFMAVDDTDVYWTTGHELWRTAKAGGGGRVLIAGDDATGVALDAANVYWSSDVRASIFQEPKSAKGNRVTLASGQPQPTAVAVDASWGYWVLGMPAPQEGIRRVPIGGGDQQSLAPVTWGGRLALDDTFVYFTQVEVGNEFVARVSKDGTGMQMLAMAQAPGGLAVDDTYVWWTDFDASTVSRTPKSGGPTTVIATGQTQARELVADGTCVYWMTKSTSAGPGSLVAYGK
jgi:hypothetical protein